MSYLYMLERLAERESVEKKFAQYSPHFRFSIPATHVLRSLEFRAWLDNIMERWVATGGPENDFMWAGLTKLSGQQGEVGELSFCGPPVMGCKFYWYDGTPEGTPMGYSRGLLFRDYEDKGCFVTRDIFCLGDSLSKFLACEKIHFESFVRLRADRTEQIRHRFPV